MMAKHFRDLTEEEKASHRVTEDARDDSLVYCPNCDRAMEQSDCMLDGNIAAERLHGWDAYRLEYAEETAHWPDTPSPGECYSPEGDAP